MDNLPINWIPFCLTFTRKSHLIRLSFEGSNFIWRDCVLIAVINKYASNRHTFRWLFIGFFMDSNRFAVSGGDLGRFFWILREFFGAIDRYIRCIEVCWSHWVLWIHYNAPTGAMNPLSAMDQFPWCKGLIGISKEYLIFVRIIRRFSL